MGAARVGRLEVMLGPSRGQVAAMLGHLERWWGYDGPFWAVLGPMLGSLEVCWGLGARLGRLAGMLGPS